MVKDTSNCPMLPGISLVGEKLAGLTLVGDMLVGPSLTGDRFSCLVGDAFLGPRLVGEMLEGLALTGDMLAFGANLVGDRLAGVTLEGDNLNFLTGLRVKSSSSLMPLCLLVLRLFLETSTLVNSAFCGCLVSSEFLSQNLLKTTSIKSTKVSTA